MSNIYRALCAELVALDGHCVVDCTEEWADAMCRLRAALAQPEPVAPTDEEIHDWGSQCADLTRRGAADHYWAFDLQSDDVAGVVRAALARWGTPTNHPVPAQFLADNKVVVEKDGDMIRVHEMTSILANIGEIESLEALAYSLLHHPRFTVNPR